MRALSIEKYGKLEFSRQIFEDYSNIKFGIKVFSGSRVVPCGQTDGRTNITELIVAFAILWTRPKTGTESGTKLIRNRSFISGTVAEYPGQIFILLYEHIYTILTKKKVHINKNETW